MKSALIVTDLDPASPDRSQANRLAQVASLYLDAGLVLDLICIQARPQQAVQPAWPGPLRQIAFLPTDGAGWPGDDKILDLAEILSAPYGAYEVLHLDGLDLAEHRSVARIWVRDARDKIAGLSDRYSYDIGLAVLDETRGNLAGRCTLSCRLPLTLPGTAPGPTADMIGWAGDWLDGAADGWTALLSDVARWGQRPRHGLLLAGPGQQNVAVPPVLERHVTRAAVSAPSVDILALGVLPADSVAGNIHAISRLLSRSVPVLLSSTAAEQFEDRWLLPTYDRPSDMATAMLDWSSGQSTQSMAHDTQRTRDAFAYDIDRMTAHVTDVLRSRLAP